jgi:hypothetical protein
MAGDAKEKARGDVRRAQAEFERAQERVQLERAKARAMRRERFAQAQKDGLTVRDIADEVGLDFSHIAEIIRGE